MQIYLPKPINVNNIFFLSDFSASRVDYGKKITL